MFTKTGLRPCEVQSLEARAGIGKKLPPITTTPHRRDFHACGGGVTAVSSTRRKKAGGRSSSSVGSRGRREVFRHGGGSGGGSRSQSAGRKREVSNTLRAHRLARKRPEWDDSLRDTSQYRLTAEEALRRKVSLVSKHNSLVFGLSGGCNSTSKNAVASSSSVGPPPPPPPPPPSVTEVALGCSTKKLQQLHLRHARKARDGGGGGGGGASAVSSRSSSRSISAIYGGGGGGGSGGCKGKVTVLDSAPATDADLTAASSEEGGEPAGGVNDATLSLYSKHAASVDEHLDGRSDGRSDGGSDGSGSGGGSSVIDKEVGGGGAPSLAGLDVGIKAFSERVGRLDAYRKADLLEKRTAGKRSESEDQDRGETDCCSSNHRPDDVSLSHAAVVHDGSVSGDLLPHRTPKHDGSGHQPPAATAHSGAGSGVHNPWSFAVPSSSSFFRDQRRRREEATARSSSSTGDGGGGEEVGLVERMELLEARVLQMCPASSPVIASTTSSTAGSANQDQKVSPRRIDFETAAAAAAPGKEHTAREEQLRGVVVDLLSLSAALLARATTAERRLCELGRGGTLGVDSSIVADSVVADSGGVYERARRVRTSAEAVVVLDGGDGDAVSTTAVGRGGVRAGSAAATGASGAASTAGASSLRENVEPLPSGRTPRSASPPPPRWSTTPRSAATDCWGEALDAVGRLMDSQPSGIGLGETANKPSSPSSSSSPPRSPSSLILPPTTSMGSKRVPAAAAAAVTATPSPGLAETGSLPGQLPLLLPPPPPPPQNTGCDSSGVARLHHRWRAAPQSGVASTAFLLDTAGATVALATGGGGAGGGYSCAARQNQLEGPLVGGRDEEDARASPASSAPSPSRKPQHPFRDERSTPMRSPKGLRRHVGQARGGTLSGPEPRRGFAPASCPEGAYVSCYARELGGGGGGGGGGGCDRVNDKAPRPPIGQWYTPPPLVQD